MVVDVDRGVVERDGVRRVLDATGTSISLQMRLSDARAFSYQSTMFESWAIGPVNRWVSSMNTTKSPDAECP